MRIFMFPTFHQANDYGPALVGALQEQGADVRYLSPWTRFLPLRAIFQACGWPPRRLVHLHWIGSYTIKPYLWQTLLAAPFFLLELALLKALGYKLVWTIHDYYAHHGNQFLRIDRWLRRLTARLVDAIIIHSQAAGEQASRLYGLPERHRRKMHPIPLGHYLGSYPNRLAQAEARAKLSLPPGDFLYGLFGYICPYKGVLPLVHAFRQLPGDELRLLIAGKPLEAAFGQVVADAAAGDERIDLRLAFIPGESLQVYLNAVDVVVLPFEPCPAASSLLLAMSFGKAVIASADIASAVETLPPHGGLIYDAGDPQGLRRALEEIRSLDTAAMGLENLANVRHFGWDTIARATLQVYHQAAKFHQ
ncbi:MAG: glycosyltransferase family 4 protein [Chloroflexota bacterium]